MGQRKGSPFPGLYVREKERERKRKKKSKPLSSILRVLLVEIRRVKSESSSTRRGLRMCTKSEGFHRRSKGGDSRKSRISG